MSRKSRASVVWLNNIKWCLDPDRMRALGITLNRVKEALRNSNNETGGSVLGLGEAEYAVPRDRLSREP